MILPWSNIYGEVLVTFTLMCIGPEDTRALYRRMKRDFPSSERAPYFAVRRGVSSGLLEGYFMLLGGDICGYAVCTPLDSEESTLINYLAVEPEARGQGAGTALLGLLAERYPGHRLVLEVENPAFEKDAVKKDVMLRRISFYERAGYHIIDNVRYRLFGVEMLIMTSSGGPAGDVSALMRAFYLPALRNGRLMKFVEVIDERGAAENG